MEENSTNVAESVYEKLKAPFPAEAYSVDNSRGFALTSLKAQYVRERLNDALGFMNWQFDGNHIPQEDGSILFKGVLSIRVNGEVNKISAVGYSSKKKNLGDMYKGANTDALCKAASNIGVGNEVFKGLIDANSIGKSKVATETNAGIDAASDTVKKKSSFRKPKKKVEDDDDI